VASNALRAARVNARRDIVPLTVDDVLAGDVHEFHDSIDVSSDGTCARWRRNGKLQTWKTRPGQFRQPVKHGLRHYFQITDNNIGEFHDAQGCPVDSAS
jgi:hypothetical protein